MDFSLYVYVLPIVAVIIGYVISSFLKPESSSGFKLLLAFSGAYLLAVTVLELIPDTYMEQTEGIGIFIMLGLLLQIILEFISKGVEHGHMHVEENRNAFPAALLLSLGIHALLEGFPLDEGNHLLHGVVIHKIPVAAILAAFLKHSKISTGKTILFLLIFALMTPLGSFLKQNIQFFSDYAIYLNAIVIGIFLHVSTTILFEASKNHSFNISKLVVIILGILLAYFL